MKFTDLSGGEVEARFSKRLVILFPESGVRVHEAEALLANNTLALLSQYACCYMHLSLSES